MTSLEVETFHGPATSPKNTFDDHVTYLSGKHHLEALQRWRNGGLPVRVAHQDYWPRRRCRRRDVASAIFDRYPDYFTL